MNIEVIKKDNILYINITTNEAKVVNGGKGSGNWGHSSDTRIGKIGGSDSEKGGEQETITTEKEYKTKKKEYNQLCNNLSNQNRHYFSQEQLKEMETKRTFLKQVLNNYRFGFQRQQDKPIIPLNEIIKNNNQKMLDIYNQYKKFEKQVENMLGNEDLLYEIQEDLEKLETISFDETYSTKEMNRIIQTWLNNGIYPLQKKINKLQQQQDIFKKEQEKRTNIKKNYLNNLNDKPVDLEIQKYLSNAWDYSKEAKEQGNIGHFSDWYIPSEEDTQEDYKKAQEEYAEAHRNRQKLYDKKTEEINKAIQRAEQLGYNYGKKDNVIYFDLPNGRQISFHDPQNVYKTDKEYIGEWCNFITSQNPLKNTREEYIKDITTNKAKVVNGGKGSGNWGHSSDTRIGKVGGSDSEKGSGIEEQTQKKNSFSEFNLSQQKKFLKAKEKLAQSAKFLRENENKDKETVRTLIDKTITPLFKELNKKAKEEVSTKEEMIKQQEYFKTTYDIIEKIGQLAKQLREQTEYKTDSSSWGIKENKKNLIQENINNVLSKNEYDEQAILDLNKQINDWHKATYIDFLSKDDKLDFDPITNKYYGKQAEEKYKKLQEQVKQEINKELNALYGTNNLDFSNDKTYNELEKIYKGKKRLLKELNKQEAQIRTEKDKILLKYSPHLTSKEYITEIQEYLKSKGYKGIKVHSSYPKSLSEYWIIYNPKTKDLKMLRYSDHYEFKNYMDNWASLSVDERDKIIKKMKVDKNMYSGNGFDMFKHKHWGEHLPKNSISQNDYKNTETYKGFAFWDINEDNLKNIYNYNNY